MSTTNCARMDAQQPGSTTACLLGSRIDWKTRGETLSRGCDWSVGCGMEGPLIAAQSNCAHRKDTGASSCQPWPRDQAAASGPVSGTKANTRFCLRAWLCTACLITERMRLLQREKASCRLCSQLFCSFAGPLPVFSCCVSAIVVWILKCTCCPALAHGPFRMRHGLRRLQTLGTFPLLPLPFINTFSSTPGHSMHCYMECKLDLYLQDVHRLVWIGKKKKWTTLKLRIILYLVDKPKNLSQKTASQIVLIDCPGEERQEPEYIGVLQQKPGNSHIKRLLSVKENQASQRNDFSTFLCRGRCKSLGSLKSFLWCAP